MKRRIRVDHGCLELFERLARDGYVIGDGKRTRKLAYHLTLARIPKISAYDPNTRRVVLAFERKLNVKQVRRTLRSAIFELRDI